MDTQSSKKRTDFSRSTSIRLPTPPPDPVDSPTKEEDTKAALIDKENEFLEYLNSLPSPIKIQLGEKPNLQRTQSIFAPAIAAEDAFDHLDKLYKLMEQLLNLREQNAKLQRKVRDLEHLRNIQNIHNDVTKPEEVQMPDLDEDAILSEAILDNMFAPAQNKRSMKQKSPQFKFRQSILRTQRDRSFSLAVEPLEPRLGLPRNCSGKSLPESIRKPSKVSKWTKVKAAFKWEKASPTVSGAKSTDSGIGGMQPVNNEVARYLRVPSNCDNGEASPADSVLSGSWQGVHALSTPGTLSPASSTDELNPSTQSEHRSISRTESAGNNNPKTLTCRTSDEDEGDRRSRSLDLTGSGPFEYSTNVNKSECAKIQNNKSHKTPWGKVKDIIQTRKDSLKKKQYRLSARSDDYRTTDYSAGSDQEDVFEPAPLIVQEEKIAPTVTVTYDHSKPGKSNEYYNDSKIPANVLARYQKVAAEEEKNLTKNESPRPQRRVSKWSKVKHAFLTSSTNQNEIDSRSVPSSPTVKQSHFFTTYPNIYKHQDSTDNCLLHQQLTDDLESRKLKEEIYQNYEKLQQKLSQEFQEKLQEWEKLKQANNSTTSNSQNSNSGCASPEDQCDPEFQRKIEEWERIKNQNTESQKKRNLQMTSEENLPADFKKKLQEWQKIKKFGSTQDDSRKKKTEWQLWRSNSSHKQEAALSLAQAENQKYSEDFLKKLDEWKQIKSAQTDDLEKAQNNTSPRLTRKSSKLMRQSKKHKMQEWLEKELQKIEREKHRLEKEREKFLEREERLAKLRRSISSGPNKKDVLVQTSTGFYRFEGISRKFTQKLYEWEKARGIGPEDSTFALLSSGYNQILPNQTRNGKGTIHDNIPGIKLTRSKSMDSVANNLTAGPSITHQPSSLSLNDMEELEMQCLAESPSEQNLNESEDNLDFTEPEAVIVEVEDFVEETAAPLEPVVKEQTPIYYTEVLKLCESEKCEAPQVRRSESAKALSNYNLIQESLNILNKMRNNEDSCRLTEMQINDAARHHEEKVKQEEFARSTGAIPKRKQLQINLNVEIKESFHNSLNELYSQQIELCENLSEKIQKLQKTNITFTKNISSDSNSFTKSQISDTVNRMQDLSNQLVATTDKLIINLSEREAEFCSLNSESKIPVNNMNGQEIMEFMDVLFQKIKELKRSLSYFCAASDITAPGRRKKGSYKDRKNTIHKRASLEQIPVTQSVEDNTSDEDEDTKRPNNKTKLRNRREKLVKSKSEDNQMINYAKVQVTSVGNQRKERIERSYQLNKPSASLTQFPNDKTDTPKLTQKYSLDETQTYDNCRKIKIHRKLLRTRRISDSLSDSNPDEKKPNEIKDEINNVIIATNTQYLDAINTTTSEIIPTSPVSVFVQTTRKVFTPFTSNIFDPKLEVNQNKDKSECDVLKNKLLRRSHSPSGSPLLPRKRRITTMETNEETEQQSRPSTPSHLPPLPSSPIAQRRERSSKETSPAIRLMIARYNQKLSEHDTNGNRSGGSSGSASPVAWKSPVFERRVRAQTEKYQEEVNKPFISKCSPLFTRKPQVMKSASVTVMHPQNVSQSQTSSPKLIRGILKSTSMDSKVNQLTRSVQLNDDQTKENIIKEKPFLKLSIPPAESNPVIQERATKLQKAKEEFLLQQTQHDTSKVTCFNKTEDLKYPARNRLSQVSVGSESSCDDSYPGLMKSASAGMINIDEITYQQFRPEIHSEGYVSLPRSTKKKDGKFGLTSLTSKFRKVKMRRNKEKETTTAMNTISTLCRQSLVVDITSQERTNSREPSSSNESQPSSTKTNWIKNPTKIFKQK